MGWWPFSSSDALGNVNPGRPETGAQPKQPPPKRDFSLTDEQRIRIFGRPGPAKGSPDKERTDEEVNAFLREFGAEATPKPAESSPAPYPAIGGIVPPTRTAQPQPQTQSQTPAPANVDDTGRRIHPDGSLDISPDAMYPRTMSCRQAFDQAFYCQSLGGKFNDIYRHGSLQPCSEQWAAFWFCMRIRTYAEKDKEELISDHYKGREERKKKQFGSSEDVWDLRTKAVTKAFSRDPDQVDGGLLVRE